MDVECETESGQIYVVGTIKCVMGSYSLGEFVNVIDGAPMPTCGKSEFCVCFLS